MQEEISNIDIVSEDDMSEFERREGLKSRLMEEEARRRGYEVKRLTFDTALISIQGIVVLFKDMNGPLSSAALNTVVDDKHVTRTLLKAAGLTVPQSTYLPISEQEEIVSFAESIGYPVVLKPNGLARSQGVFMNLSSKEELKEAISKLEKIVDDKQASVHVEKHFIGEDFRYVVVDGRVIATSQRARANVVGDGTHTVLELIEAKNKERLKDRDLKNFLIPTDIEKLTRLTREGRSLDTIPEPDEKVILRDESNISSGGEGIDYTETVHPEFEKLALQAVKAIPGLNYAGVDMILEDITEAPTPENHVVTEVEFSPGPVSMFPWSGEVRDMPGPILDFYERNLGRLKPK